MSQSDFNGEFIRIAPCSWDLLQETSLLDSEAFENDGLTPTNISLLARTGYIFAIQENLILTAEAIVLNSFQPNTAFLFSLAVAKEYRNIGRGKLLMNHILEELKKKGISQLELTVAPENTTALHLYLDCLGFEKTAYVENHFGPGKHRFLLRKKI